MNVGVAYANERNQVWLKIDVPDGSTVRDAIDHSGILKRFPEIDLESQKIGIFGKLAKLDQSLREGDRVEIYRPIIADPKTAKRRLKGDDEDDE